MMMKMLTFTVILATVILTGCATQSAFRSSDSVPDFSGSIAEENKLPQLHIEAYPRVGFAPLRVSFKALLQNVPENDPVFACIWESWDFGDGAVSSEKAGCDSADAIVDLQYLVEHVYRSEGVYKVRFILGNNQVFSRPVLIRVMGKNY